MGTWSEDAFGNDKSADWAGDFADDPDVGKIDSAIDAVVDESTCLDDGVAWRGLAACEAVARLRGNWGRRSPYSEGLDKWIEGSDEIPSDDLVSRAAAAIDRILGEHSEMRELWEKDGPATKWRAEMADLRRRVLT